MSLYFITKRNDHLINDSKIIIERSLDKLIDYLTQKEQISLDKEFSSLNVFKAVPLLTQIGDKDTQFVIDDTSIDLSPIGNLLASKLILGHNIGIDYKIWKRQGYGLFRNVYDTMIAEQVITRGLGYSVSLENTIKRRLDILPLAKEIRISFIGMGKNAQFTDKHIYYAADDIMYLEALKEIQETYIEKRNLYKDLYEIEFPLITLLEDASLQGCKLDEEKWKINISNNEKKIVELENEMNRLLINLSSTFEGLKKVYIKKKIVKQQSIQQDLFSEGTFIETSNIKGINYNSSKQIVNLFHLMGIEIPIDNENKESISKEALEDYLNLNRGWLDTRILDFIDLLLQYKGAIKNISSFGYRFLVEAYKKGVTKNIKPGYKSLITGKVHTIYRSCNTETTRMSSGDAGKKKKKNDPPIDIVYFNSQQIPKPKEYRNCFIADEGKAFTTCDLSAAELIISGSNSKDKRLLELAQSNDVHSPLATVCYNEIISYILGNFPERRAREELALVFKVDSRLLSISLEEARKITQERVDHIMKYKKFEITSKTASDIRTHFKNVVYGLSYGAGADKIGNTLNIAKVYAQIVENAMKKELPDFFAYQERVVKQAITNGFIQFHPDYGSTHIFQKVMEYKKWKKPLPNKIKGEVERAAKNYPIQGVQGLMIKKAIVNYFYNYVFPNNYDIQLIFIVHDEVLIQHKREEPEHGVMLSTIMNETANEFLNEVKMKSEYKTLPYWTK